MRRQRRNAGPTLWSDIPVWSEGEEDDARPADDDAPFGCDAALNARVAQWSGDMTALEIDGIVNAANTRLLGGGGIDGAIHRAAGRGMLEECRALCGCSTGQTKVTAGHALPAKHVLHTVGPIGEKPAALASCYRTCLEQAARHGMRAVCFCCISTGIYGYPNRAAAHVALRTAREWLQAAHAAADDGDGDGGGGGGGGAGSGGSAAAAVAPTASARRGVQRIVFCTFMPEDARLYAQLLPRYFPRRQARQGAARPAPCPPRALPNSFTLQKRHRQAREKRARKAGGKADEGRAAAAYSSADDDEEEDSG